MGDVTREQALEVALTKMVKVHRLWRYNDAGEAVLMPDDRQPDWIRDALAALAMPPAQGVEFTRGWEAGPESLELLAFHLRNMADSMPMDQIDADRISRAANVIDSIRTPPAPAPWTPPEDRPYNYECLGWIYDGWDFVFWVDDHWQTRRGNRCNPAGFHPIPLSPFTPEASHDR